MNTASACEPTQAREEADRFLSRRFGNDNHIFVGPTIPVAGTQGRDWEVSFSLLSKDQQLFEVGDIGKIYVEESNQCLTRIQAVSSTLLK